MSWGIWDALHWAGVLVAIYCAYRAGWCGGYAGGLREAQALVEAQSGLIKGLHGVIEQQKLKEQQG